MNKKYGIIVRFPNYILENYPDSSLFREEVLSKINKHMEIMVYSCDAVIQQDFLSDISLVRLTASHPVTGLAEHSSFGQLVQKDFPVDKYLFRTGRPG